MPAVYVLGRPELALVIYEGVLRRFIGAARLLTNLERLQVLC